MTEFELQYHHRSFREHCPLDGRILFQVKVCDNAMSSDFNNWKM
jgi:hypothetical protein